MIVIKILKFIKLFFFNLIKDFFKFICQLIVIILAFGVFLGLILSIMIGVGALTSYLSPTLRIFLENPNSTLEYKMFLLIGAVVLAIVAFVLGVAIMLYSIFKYFKTRWVLAWGVAKRESKKVKEN